MNTSSEQEKLSLLQVYDRKFPPEQRDALSDLEDISYTRLVYTADEPTYWKDKSVVVVAVEMDGGRFTGFYRLCLEKDQLDPSAEIIRAENDDKIYRLPS